MGSRLLRTGVAVLALLLAGAGLAACSSPDTSLAAARRPRYFDLRGAVEQQMQALDRRRAAVRKQVSLRGQPAQAVRVPAVKWANELQIFLQADINKAALRGAYAVDSVLLPNGRLRRRYTRRPGYPNAPVTQLTVVSEGAAPREIAAVIVQQNSLFTTTKQLSLTFEQGQLRRYAVRGVQKLVFFDALRYAAVSQVE